MTTTRIISARTFSRLDAADVDIGYSGTPGSGATRITCTIYARRDGRWDCTGAYSSGQNQGYYEENYSYGPWQGRGDTPEAAVRAMVSRADDEHRDAMRRAGHDALLGVDGCTWADLLRGERDRIRLILECGEGPGCRYCTIGTERYYRDTREGRDELRRAALKVLDRLCGADRNPLAEIDDSDLLAEIERRGLLTATR